MRPCIQEVRQRLSAICGVSHIAPIERNKGKPGHLLETLLGIPHSSSCLDLTDGEVKCAPFKTKKGVLVPKETVCVTMVSAEDLTKPFRESRVYEKLKNCLFVRYTRNGDSITYDSPIYFTESSPLMPLIEADYLLIQEKAKEGQLSSSFGSLLQTRTKGPGHGSTSRAFYLKKDFLVKLWHIPI